MEWQKNLIHFQSDIPILPRDYYWWINIPNTARRKYINSQL